MQRYPDWQSRLDRFLVANRARAFVWGSWDCCLWVASAIEAMTGVDIADAFRGKYTDQATANAVCQTACGSAALADMAAYVAKEHALAEVSPLHAQRGDMILTTGATLGLVGLNSMLWVLAEAGLQMVDYRHIQRAWRVG